MNVLSGFCCILLDCTLMLGVVNFKQSRSYNLSLTEQS